MNRQLCLTWVMVSLTVLGTFHTSTLEADTRSQSQNCYNEHCFGPIFLYVADEQMLDARVVSEYACVAYGLEIIPSDLISAQEENYLQQNSNLLIFVDGFEGAAQIDQRIVPPPNLSADANNFRLRVDRFDPEIEDSSVSSWVFVFDQSADMCFSTGCIADVTLQYLTARSGHEFRQLQNGAQHLSACTAQ